MVREYILIARRSTIEQKNQFLGHRLLTYYNVRISKANYLQKNCVPRSYRTRYAQHISTLFSKFHFIWLEPERAHQDLPRKKARQILEFGVDQEKSIPRKQEQGEGQQQDNHPKQLAELLERKRG